MLPMLCSMCRNYMPDAEPGSPCLWLRLKREVNPWTPGTHTCKDNDQFELDNPVALSAIVAALQPEEKQA